MESISFGSFIVYGLAFAFLAGVCLFLGKKIYESGKKRGKEDD